MTASFFISKKVYLNRFVRPLIKLRGFGQKDVARYLRISTPQFSQVLDASYSIRPKTLKALSKLLGVRAATLTRKGCWRSISKNLRKSGM